MSDFNQFIPNDRAVTFADLRQLYLADKELIFRLAIEGAGDQASIAVLGLKSLASTLSVLLRDGFSIENRAQQHYAKGHLGGILSLENGREDVAFLQDLYSGSEYKSKLASKERTKKHLDFYLNDLPSDEVVRKTRMLRIAPDDAAAVLGGLPRYQYYALLDCAREVVRNPTAVYRGLRHDGLMKDAGFAFCGIPSRSRSNDGSFQDPPKGYVFVVFVSANDYVFDWDWVPAAIDNPGIPRDADERFSELAPGDTTGELILGNVRGKELPDFRSKTPWFSRQGDCVFWYHSDEPAYAGRYDEYLTPFYALSKPKLCLGFKLKMVGRLFETVRRWATTPSDHIEVVFETDPVKVDLKFLMKAWVDANLPRSKELFPGMRLLESLGSEAATALQECDAQLDIPQNAIEEFQGA